MDFVLSELCDQVMTARAGHKPLFVVGGGSKSFYGNYRPVTPQDGHCLLDMTAYSGIVSYQPSELVVTVRAGTSLAFLEAALAERGQMLAFEPPHFGASATVGGCVAAGLAGPRRMAAGAVRDFVLGVRMLDSQGRILSFGGEVMKNVAGYDVSRLLAGSHGIFGAILDVSLKVVPRPFEERTLRYEATQEQALAHFTQWRARPLPVSATSWSPAGDGAGGHVTVRLSGAPPAVRG
ncbi:glycolate oxidase subunit GlcE, partial [Bordetella petrii]|uniref:glycolate oxidase subunit GlcE n=1 Tax=Bordetella petrii TaxID=94624 RepID=UPI001E57F74E